MLILLTLKVGICALEYSLKPLERHKKIYNSPTLFKKKISNPKIAFKSFKQDL